MKILYVAHRIPFPPDKGDKIRSYHQVRALARNHEVHLACLIDDKADLPHVATLEKICASVDVAFRSGSVSRLRAGGALFSRQPLSVAAFHCPTLEKKIRRRLRSEKFDLIYVYSSAMAGYVRGTNGTPKVMDFVDMDSEKWRHAAQLSRFPLSWVYRTEAERLARYERRVAGSFDYSLFVSQREADVFRRLIHEGTVCAIPNGVDVDYFSPPDDVEAEPAIVFTGVMDYFPNVDGVSYFCREILGRIAASAPEVRFYIVGRTPSKQVQVLGRLPNVEVTGAVPDVRPYMARARVAVVPLRIARGIQNKILEAMAMQLPVVGTSAAFEGIEAGATDGVAIADEPEAFAREVLKLLADPALCERRSRAARNFVMRHHRWQDHDDALESVLNRAVGNRGAG